MTGESNYGEMGYTVHSHEKYTPQVPESHSPMLLAFFVGGAIGAALALLVAPKAGREIRRRLREVSRDVTERAESYCVEAKEKVSAAVDKGKGVVREGKPVIRAVVDAAREAYEKEKERLGGS